MPLLNDADGPFSGLLVSEDGEHVHLHLGRDRDRAIEGSAILPDVDELLGLRLAHAPELYRDIDGLETVRLGVAAYTFDGDLHALHGDPLLEGVFLDEGHPARRDTGEKSFAVGQRLVGARGRIQHEVIVTGAVERATRCATRVGPDSVDLDITSH